MREAKESRPSFLLELEQFVEAELESLPHSTQQPAAKLQIFQECFDRFIDAFARYAPILTRIKHEYDEALRNHDRLQTEMGELMRENKRLNEERRELIPRIHGEYADRITSLEAALKYEGGLRREYEQSNRILKDELIKCYKLKEEEKQTRLECEHVLHILTASVKADKDAIRDMEKDLRVSELECSSQKAQLQALEGKVDKETYNNARREIAVQLGRADTLLFEKNELVEKLAEVQKELVKTQNEGQQAGLRYHHRVDLRKYAAATRGPANGVNWTMQRSEKKAGEAPWLHDGKSKQASRDTNRWISALGDSCWACFLRKTSKVYYQQMSLREVWSILQTVWQNVDADVDTEYLVAQHFWDVLKARFDDTDKAICTAYNLLASSELLAWDINVDLLRGIMAGELHPSLRRRWKGFVISFRDHFLEFVHKNGGKHRVIENAVADVFTALTPKKN